MYPLSPLRGTVDMLHRSTEPVVSLRMKWGIEMSRETVREGAAAMKVETFEAIVENGQIKFPDIVQLREHTKVDVVVHGDSGQNEFRLPSPRLAKPDQAADFVKSVVEELGNARV